MNPEEVVQKQVESYNNRDIKSFLNCHHPNIELFSFPESVPYVKDISKLKEIYQDIFENSPGLNAQINNRMVMGNTVIDHEVVTGRKGVDISEIIAIYEVEDGLITKARFIRRN